MNSESPIVDQIKMQEASSPAGSLRGCIVVIQEKHLDGCGVDELIEHAEATARHMVRAAIKKHKNRECCRAARTNEPPYVMVFCETHDPAEFWK